MRHTVILPYPPSANRLWIIARGHLILSDEARQYKHDANILAVSQGAGYSLKRLCVSISVFAPRISGDLDNRIKIVLDSLQGVMFDNDSQVQEIHAYRHIDRAQPRIEVEVCEMEQ
jgi:crossover junction endodeoxyribonuclease RusA